MSEKAVITSMGVVSPIGIGKEDFFKALEEGRSGIKPVTGFKSKLYKNISADEIADFDAALYLGEKGLRNLTRSTKLILAAVKLALLNYPGKINHLREGVIIGNTFGEMETLKEHYRELIHSGWWAVNAVVHLNTYAMAPSLQITMKEKSRGPVLAVSTGQTSSLDSLGIALNYLESNQAEIILAGGVSELSLPLYLMFKKSGTLLGEGGVVFVVEKMKEKREFLAKIEGYGTAFDARSAQYSYDPEAKAAVRAIHLALKDAGVKARDIDFISSGLSGNLEGDAMELKAIKDVFGEHLPVIAIKSLIGETLDAGGAFQIAAAIYSFENQKLPQKCSSIHPSFTPHLFSHKHLKQALVTSFGFNGNNSALVIKRGTE